MMFHCNDYLASSYSIFFSTFIGFFKIWRNAKQLFMTSLTLKCFSLLQFYLLNNRWLFNKLLVKVGRMISIQTRLFLRLNSFKWYNSCHPFTVNYNTNKSFPSTQSIRIHTLIFFSFFLIYLKYSQTKFVFPVNGCIIMVS